MIYTISAVICGAATVAGIFLPTAWKSGIALTAFACGLNAATAWYRSKRGNYADN